MFGAVALALAAVVAVAILIMLYLGRGRTQRYSARPDSATPVGAIHQDDPRVVRVRSATQALYVALLDVRNDFETKLVQQGGALRAAAAAMEIPVSLERFQAALDLGLRRLDSYATTYLVTSPALCAKHHGADCGLFTLLVVPPPDWEPLTVCLAAREAQDNFMIIPWVFPAIMKAIFELVIDFKVQATRRRKPLSSAAKAAVDDLSKSAASYMSHRLVDDLARDLWSATAALCPHHH